MRETLAILRDAARGWHADRAGSMGAAIAYYAVVSMVPMLMLVTAIAGMAFGRHAAEGAIVNGIERPPYRSLQAGHVRARWPVQDACAGGLAGALCGAPITVTSARGALRMTRPSPAQAGQGVSSVPG